MSDYTVDEVLKAASVASREEEYGDLDDYDGDYTEGPSSDFWYFLYDLTLRGEVVSLTEVETTGGMDEGSHASVTFKIGDQFFQKVGYYQSHYGYEWDGDFFEVEPVQKTITVYKKK